MRNSDLNTRTRTSFLISLILHAVMALVLGLVLLESPQKTATESVAVDIMDPIKRVIPPRRTQRLDLWRSVPDSFDPNEHRARTQFEPRRLDQADTAFDTESYLSDAATPLPELSTKADRMRSRLEMPLPTARGAAIKKPGTDTSGSGRGRSGAGSIGLSPEAGIFETALYWIARNTAGRNKTGKEDIVFLIDASGSMEENIAAVARYLSRMIDVFDESHLDYTMGVVRFNRVLKENYIEVYEQTNDPDQIKTILRSIQCDGDERTLDAIEIGLTQVEYRRPVDKTFVLVTDEAFTPRTVTRRDRKDLTPKQMLELDFQEVLEMCREDSVKINVMGIDDERHKLLAKNTGGLWFQIPQRGGLP